MQIYLTSPDVKCKFVSNITQKFLQTECNNFLTKRNVCRIDLESSVHTYILYIFNILHWSNLFFGDKGQCCNRIYHYQCNNNLELKVKLMCSYTAIVFHVKQHICHLHSLKQYHVITCPVQNLRSNWKKIKAFIFGYDIIPHCLSVKLVIFTRNSWC